MLYLNTLLVYHFQKQMGSWQNLIKCNSQYYLGITQTMLSAGLLPNTCATLPRCHTFEPLEPAVGVPYCSVTLTYNATFCVM